MNIALRPTAVRLIVLFVLGVAAAGLLFSSDLIRTNAQRNEPPSVVFAGTLSGTVFQDFNGNGTFDSATVINNDGLGTVGVAIDRGVANVEVRAYDALGANVTTGGVVLTGASGTFSITTTGAGAGPYRIEFTALPTGYYPSARSTDSVNGGAATNSGSTVQFVSAGATNINLAINYPSDYSQNNPEVVASLYSLGDQIVGTNNVANVLSSFPYSAGSNSVATNATELLYDAPTTNPLDIAANQLGTTYGLAYARSSRLLYASAFFKRYAGFGPQGPNAVYVVSRTGTGSVSTFFNVPGTVTNAHDTTDYNRDNNNTGWDAVGKTSLGGMAISEDEASLFVYNLANRSLYKLKRSDGSQTAVQATMPTLPLPVGNCAAGDARPFALTIYHGQLYAGIICSAESSVTVDTFTDTNANGQYDPGDYFIDANLNNIRDAGESYLDINGNGSFDAGEAFVDNDGNRTYNTGNATKLRAYVYTVDQTTLAYSASPVFQMPLNYRRGLTTHISGAVGIWRPWSTTYRNSSTGVNRTVYAQPMLTDIAFDNGNMILGLRDRVGDQVGNGTPSNPADVATAQYQPRTAGDVIRACGSIGTWTVEANGRCGGGGSAPQNVSEGLGGGEFYYGDAYDLTGDFISPALNVTGKGSNHDETGSGGVEQLPGAPDVMMSDFDPIPNIANMTHDGGIRWLSNSTGNFTKAYRMYNGTGNDMGVFGKAGGVGGNLTILVNPAPIELGNRVWRDANLDGVQDPGEAGIGAVTVHLYNSTNVLIATAVTDASGEYYFVSGAAADPNTTDNIGIVNGQILAGTAYQIRFDNPANYTTGNPLFGLYPTARNQTSQLGDDRSSDSDTLAVVNPTGSPAGIFSVISVTTGAAGTNDHTLDAGFRLGPSAAGVDVNGQILTAGGNGIRNALVVLTESDGTVHTSLTGAFGYYDFDDITAGQVVVVTVYSKRYTFAEPARAIALGKDVPRFDFIAEN